MKSCVVVWCDFFGRLRFKSYLYLRCAEKFAVKLLSEGDYQGKITVEVFKDGKRISRKISKGVR